MNSRIAGMVLSALTATSLGAAQDVLPIIPQPQKIERQAGVFLLRPGDQEPGLGAGRGTRILVNAASRDTGQYLAARLRSSTGYSLEVVTSIEDTPGEGDILLSTRDAKTSLGAEGYELKVAPDSVVIRAPEQAGLFYGVQTLLQLLPPEIFSSNVVRGVEWRVPCVRIEDWPRFKWRGLMLDVSRHFFNKQEVEHLLDAMAMQKLNVFHWHLTDDQGWRIEIKKYPKLTQIGAWRSGVGFGLDPKSTTAYSPDGRYGGYYTQEDIREVVAYAAARHITIVPEIEMPGHASAALSAYPEFSCTGGPFTPPLKGGIFNGIYCAGNDATFQFLEDVLTEVFQLFPGKYVHIGGDEVPKDNWKACAKCQARIKSDRLGNEEGLQSYFIRRVETFVNAHGHRLIGWSEILQGGLAQNATVMDWIGGGVEAASTGHDVVMSPTTYCYFDQYQSTNHATEPRAIGGFLPLRRVYSFEPIPAKLAPEFDAHILGGQANLWTEYIPSFSHAEYMIFPRLCALAEVLWSPKDGRDWDGFQGRLRVHEQRLAGLGVNFRHEDARVAAQRGAKEDPGDHLANHLRRSQPPRQGAYQAAGRQNTEHLEKEDHRKLGSSHRAGGSM